MNIITCPDVDACVRSASAGTEAHPGPRTAWKRRGGLLALSTGTFAGFVGSVLLGMSLLGPFEEFARQLLTAAIVLLVPAVPLVRLGFSWCEKPAARPDPERKRVQAGLHR